MMPNDMSGTPTSTLEATERLLPVPELTYAQRRLQVMERLQKHVRLNEYNLPTQIYRPDQIPADLYERPQSEQQDILAIACVPIMYEGGLPVVEGRLYWEQLPWEPRDEYAHFVSFRNLQTTFGYRSINLLLPPIPEGQEPNPEAEATILEALRKHYIYYAWGFRVKAYDMVANVAYERLRERRAVETENYHYMRLDKALKRVFKQWDHLESDSDDAKAAWQEVGVVDTVKIMGQLMQLQRVAAGLPAATPLTAKEEGAQPLRGMPMETRMVHQAKQQAQLEDRSADTTITAEDILKDPKLAEMAQKLILGAQLSQDASNPNSGTNTNEGIDTSDTAAAKLAEKNIPLNAGAEIAPAEEVDKAEAEADV